MGVISQEVFKLLLKSNRPKLRLRRDWRTTGMCRGMEKDLARQGLLD